ncbi:MAG: MerR family transcriptional regulator [Fibrobacterota bacterium]
MGNVEYKMKEFCRLTGLSRKALLIYEEKELLEPARINDETGYRYYSEKELILASRISFLRSLDCSIDEVFEVLISGDRALQKILRNKGRAYVASYQKLQHTLTACNLSLEKEDHFFRIPPPRPFFQKQTLSLEGYGTARDVAFHIDYLHRFCRRRNVAPTDSVFTVYYADSQAQQFHFRVYYPTAFADSVTGQGIRKEPFSRPAVLFFRHFGTYETLPVSYGRLQQICTSRGLQIQGEYIERYRTVPTDKDIADTSTLITDIGAILC